jgi:RNase P/RNase MRP subunit p29
VTTLIVSKNAIGMRVQLAPHLDRWMMGDRYGEIVNVTRKSIHVHLDKSGKTIRLLPDQFTFA